MDALWQFSLASVLVSPNQPWVLTVFATSLTASLAGLVVLFGKHRHQQQALAAQIAVNATLQKKYEELFDRAKAREDFIRVVIDAVPHRIFVKDRQGRYVLVNKARAEWSGLTVAQMEGRLESELNPRIEQVAAFQRDDHEVMNTLREKFIAEEKLTNAQDCTVWLQTVKRPLVEIDGTSNQVLGVSTDITQRKRTEILLNSVLENLPVAVFMKDARDLRFVLWNRANEELCGIPKSEILGKTDHDFFPTEQADSFNAKDRETLRRGELVEIEEQILTRHRGCRTFRTRKIPIFDEEGRPLHLLGISEDVTETRRAETELVQERAMLLALMDGSPDCIYFKDCESRFTRASRAFVKFGLAPEAIIGKNDFDLFQEAHARPAFEDEQEIMRTGQPMIGKVEKEVLLGGEERWALTSKMPWRGADGKILGTFGISKDITGIKLAETKLEVVHKQLLETSRQAGMAEVATSVLHNVGNVLNSINVSASLISDKLRNSKIIYVGKVSALLHDHAADLSQFISRDPKGQQLPAYLAQLSDHLNQEHSAILKETEELVRNIDHVKDIVATQQSYAKVSGITEPIVATDLIEDALRMNASALEKQDVQVVRQYAPELPKIMVDKHKLLQVLVNLIRNAKLACAESGLRARQITIGVRLQPTGGRLIMDIADNGVGISSENLTKIFQHGFTTRSDGHGFGLHSGALAAKEMGGDLRAHSEGRGKGAVFTLELPLRSSC